MTHLVAIAALGCQQNRTGDGTVGVSRFPDVMRGVFGLGFAGVKANLTEWFRHGFSVFGVFVVVVVS